MDDYLRNGRSFQGPPVPSRQMGNQAPGAPVAINPNQGVMPFLSPPPTPSRTSQGMSGRSGLPSPSFVVPEASPRAPQKNPLAFLERSPSGSLAGSLGAANYPNSDTISNLGDSSAAQSLAARSQGASLATQGYQPIGDEGSAGIMRQVVANPGFGPENPNRKPAPGQSAGTTTYQVPGVQGQAVFQGLPAQQRGGFMVQDQGNGGTVEGNVAVLNRQIEAQRSLREARNPGITTGDIGQVQAPKAVDIWARPGDAFGDSQRRAQEYASLLSSAGSERGWGANRRAAAKVAAAQAMAAPGLETAKIDSGLQASRDSLAGHLATSQAARYGADIRAAQQAAEARQQGLMEQQKLGLEQQKAIQQQAVQDVQMLKGMTDVEREGKLNEMAMTLDKTDPKSPEYSRLANLYMLIKRGMEPKEDSLAAFLK